MMVTNNLAVVLTRVGEYDEAITLPRRLGVSEAAGLPGRC
jgi:hypothetical protein